LPADRIGAVDIELARSVDAIPWRTALLAGLVSASGPVS
jgi:hypothetical protein